MEGKIINIAGIESIRQELHNIVDSRIDDFIIQHIIGKSEAKGIAVRYGLLSSKTAIFKGTRPISVTFSDGHIEQTNTWKKVVTAILVDCTSNKVMHNSLVELTGKIFGNFRPIISSSPDKLKAPLKINDNIYFEGKYDTETLLYVLKHRVLDVVGYDYNAIIIQYKET